MLIRLDLLLRVEAFFVLVASVICYSELHGSWVLFAVFFLAPDLSLLAYLAEYKRFAATIYNAAHFYAVPLVMGLIAWSLHRHLYEELAVIWVAHIAFDRFLGFGLKYAQAFQPTHIQNVSNLHYL